MKKSILALTLALATAFTFMSCLSDDSDESAAVQANENSRVIGADGVPRPNWVLAGKEDATGIYAVGSGKMSNDVNSLKVAKANARNELSKTVQVATKSVLRTYAQDTGIAKDTINYMEEAIEQKTNNLLEGSRQVDMWQAEDGTIYVLMYLPYKAVLPAVKQIADNYKQDVKSQLTEEKAKAAFKKYFDEVLGD
ncbi:MAG: LPP20 family lipoprotein [Treponema sp.]|nr:LPP20 family lipoprotein [Treponema sp.]